MERRARQATSADLRFAPGNGAPAKGRVCFGGSEMRFLLRSGLFLPALACSSTPAAPVDAGPADAAVEVGPEGAAPGLSFSLGATVAPTEDSYHCKYVAVPSGAGFLVGASHTYGAGCRSY